MPRVCEAACDADARCEAWTYVLRPPEREACCLKSAVPRPDAKASCTSGVKGGVRGGAAARGRLGSGAGAHGSATDLLALLPGDDTLTLRLLLDGPVAEAYFMGGRVAITQAIAPHF